MYLQIENKRACSILLDCTLISPPLPSLLVCLSPNGVPYLTRRTLSASPRAVILTSVVAVWAARLGTYLFRRILKRGEDERLKSFFPHHHDDKWTPKQVIKLGIFWMLQGTWGFVTMLPITYVHGLSPLGAPSVRKG